jgi:hypothetical protein
MLIRAPRKWSGQKVTRTEAKEDNVRGSPRGESECPLTHDESGDPNPLLNTSSCADHASFASPKHS